MHRVVVVGAGHAGGVAASALRSAGFAGSIVLIGEEEWAPYERPALSKSLLAGKSPVEKVLLAPAAAYAERRIELKTGLRVEAIQRSARRIALSDGSGIAYDTLVLATGARPRLLDAIAPGRRGVHYLRNLGDMLRLRDELKEGARVVIVGAGFIGLEVAATARQMRCTVTVLEVADRVLARSIPHELAPLFTALHHTHGVTIRLGTKVRGLGSAGDAVLLELDGGDPIEADVIVVGVGATPNTELASAAGLVVDDGILTDQFGRTSDPSIYAIGDVTRHFNPILGRHIRLEAWQNAQDQARAIANIVAGREEPYASVPWFWTDQFDLNFQSAGVVDPSCRLIWRGSPNLKGSSVFYWVGGRVVGGACVNNGRDLRPLRRLIASGGSVDPVLLGDPNVKLSALAG